MAAKDYNLNSGSFKSTGLAIPSFNLKKRSSSMGDLQTSQKTVKNYYNDAKIGIELANRSLQSMGSLLDEKDKANHELKRLNEAAQDKIEKLVVVLFEEKEEKKNLMKKVDSMCNEVQELKEKGIGLTRQKNLLNKALEENRVALHDMTVRNNDLERDLKDQKNICKAHVMARQQEEEKLAVLTRDFQRNSKKIQNFSDGKTAPPE